MSSGSVAFGLVSIPVKLYSAVSPQGVRFNQLHDKCGSRIRQQLYCPVDEEVIERSDIVKGYEFARGQYVRFTNDELRQLQASKTDAIEIAEFVPLETVDFLYVDRSYYLGPDKGGHKPYRLLSEALQRAEKVAVGRFWTHGKEQLVLLRPYKKGLVMHQVHYADEVRAFDEIDVGKDATFKPGELQLAQQLIEQLTVERFDPSKFRDHYRDRVLEAVEQKSAGHEVSVAPEHPPAQVVDLFEALKASVERTASAAASGKGASARPVKGPKKAARERAKPPRKAVPSKSASPQRKKKAK